MKLYLLQDTNWIEAIKRHLSIRWTVVYLAWKIARGLARKYIFDILQDEGYLGYIITFAHGIQDQTLQKCRGTSYGTREV